MIRSSKSKTNVNRARCITIREYEEVKLCSPYGDKPIYILKRWWLRNTRTNAQRIDAAICMQPLTIERNKVFLIGEICKHPEFADYSIVRTPLITDTEGKYVLTTAGTVYYLHGWCDYKYQRWLKRNKIIYDYNDPQPIKIIDTHTPSIIEASID